MCEGSISVRNNNWKLILFFAMRNLLVHTKATKITMRKRDRHPHPWINLIPGHRHSIPLSHFAFTTESSLSGSSTILITHMLHLLTKVKLLTLEDVFSGWATLLWLRRSALKDLYRHVSLCSCVAFCLFVAHTPYENNLVRLLLRHCTLKDTYYGPILILFCQFSMFSSRMITLLSTSWTFDNKGR